jgi:Pyruvate/2-oxoacid:ferredoxin oxidoreductase gamma subunit
MFKNKYLKYKQKYLLLKKQYAGNRYKEDADYFDDLGKLVNKLINNSQINESELEFIKCTNFDITEDKYKRVYTLSFVDRFTGYEKSICERAMSNKKLFGTFQWLINGAHIAINFNFTNVKVAIDKIPEDYSPNILSYLNKYLINDNSRNFVFENIEKITNQLTLKTYKDLFEREYTPQQTCDELQLLNTTNGDLYKKCSFLNLYNTGGICSIPRFWDESNFIDFNDSLTEQWITLLEKIKNDYFSHIEKLIIIIGATYNDTTMNREETHNFIDESVKKKINIVN